VWCCEPGGSHREWKAQPVLSGWEGVCEGSTVSLVHEAHHLSLAPSVLRGEGAGGGWKKSFRAVPSLKYS
jgi:hypothetical protein